jgi:hypothetical protein
LQRAWQFVLIRLSGLPISLGLHLGHLPSFG